MTIKTLIRPVKKPYVVTFSYEDHIKYAKEHPDITYNGGIDYVSSFNDEYGNVIYSTNDGIVFKVGYDENGYGNYVKIQHDWGYSLYAHMKKQIVAINDIITSESPIGYIGHTGMCFDANGENTENASHVHFECRDLKNVVFDPTYYIVDREQDNNISNENENIMIGSIVYIKGGAKSYTGTELWDGLYYKPYKVDEIYNDRIVLDYSGICTPVNINDIALYNDSGNNNENVEDTNNSEETNNNYEYYTVKSGDTLWGIAYNNNITLEKIKSINNIDNPNWIQIGQKIRIK